MIGLRMVLVALGLALGVALLATGHLVIGGLIAAMAVVRGVLVFRWHAHMADRAARREAIRARVRERRTARAQ